MIFTHEKRLINPDLYKQELKKMTTLKKLCYRKADMVVNFKSEPEPSFPLSSKSHYSIDGKGERTAEKQGNAVCIQQPRSDWSCVSYHVKHQETFFFFDWSKMYHLQRIFRMIQSTYKNAHVFNIPFSEFLKLHMPMQPTFLSRQQTSPSYQKDPS